MSKRQSVGVNHLLDLAPPHWRAKRAKYLFSEVAELSVSGTETLLSVTEQRGVVPRETLVSEGEELSRAESLVGYKRCQAGDLVMNIMLAWKRALGVADQAGIVSPSYAVFRPHGLNSRFAHYLLRSDPYIDDFNRRSTGIVPSRNRLYPEEFGNTVVLLPPFEEQRRIAAFLDHETARIDELVREQERLLEQVSERFSVLRESLLTGRLRPEEGETGRLVMAGESVIPDDLAIGSARPSHWKRIPLRWLVFMKSGDAITSDDITDAGPYPVYGGNGIRGFTERMNDTGPAVLVGRQGALCGNIQRVEGPRWVSEHAVVTRPQQPSDIGWLAELLEALDLGSYSQSAAQPGLAVDRIKSLTVPVPPIREQRLIAKVLARERHQLDNLVSTISNHASVLLERRSALISAAVTGQLDLQDWRPHETEAVAEVA